MPPKRVTAPITPDPIDTALLPGFSAVAPPASTVQLPQPTTYTKSGCLPANTNDTWNDRPAL